MVSTDNKTPYSTFKKLRDQYADKLPDRLEELKVAMSNAMQKSADSPAVTDAILIAHKLFGTAGSYNFREASDLGAYCEQLLLDYKKHDVSLPEWELILGKFQKVQDILEDNASKQFLDTSINITTDTKGRILVVDDDNDFLVNIAEILEQDNYGAFTTTDNKAIANLIEEVQPDLILLDVEMPEKSGFKLCGEIKNDTRWKDIPIIFLTTHSDIESRIAAFKVGGDDFINKPIVVQELLTRINVRIEKGRLGRERLSLLQNAEKQRDSLLSLLDQLQVGTLLLDANGQIEFISRYCGRIGLEPASGIAQHWKTVLPLTKDNRFQIEEQMELPAEERSKLPLSWKSGKRQYFVLCEILEVPNSSKDRIVCLTDVSELHRLQRELEHNRYGKMVGISKPMRELYGIIDEVAQGDWTVLIEGETGVGKELVAHSIHAASPRKDGPFITVNSAGFSESLLASQLFGHRKGAFTGAETDQEGFFEAAHGGTIFLDEIGDLPLNMQTSLLRVIQEKEVTRLGETKARKVNIRILAATHKSLATEAKAGRFREDLLYRLRVARIHIPALRERKADIPLLVESFLSDDEHISSGMQPRFSPEAMQCLSNYDWPGNVRELKAATDYSAIHCRGELINPDDLPIEVRQVVPATVTTESELIPDAGDEQSRINAALAKTDGNRLRAAKLLGMSRATFYRRLSKYGISVDS